MQRPSDNKLALRKSLREQRDNLSSTLQKEKSNRIVKQIAQSSLVASANHIAFYSPVHGEANPLLLTKLKNFSDDKKQFYLPILQGDNEPLLFAPFSNQNEFSNNRFSIPEPIVTNDQLTKGSDLDLVLMPLLGFDRQGNRLGMGGGFYDRTFAFKDKQNNKPLLIGIAYDFQEIVALKAENWDIPLDYIATESELICAR